MNFYVDANTKILGYKEKVMELVERRLKDGFLCELNPESITGTSAQQLAHAARINHKRVCAKITDVILVGDVFTFKVDPHGPLGETFNKLIGEEDSLRVSTRLRCDYNKNRTEKTVTEVFGFDISYGDMK